MQIPYLQALQAISRGRTTLVIAHRLSTVAGADTIAVLDRGKVAEIGTHQQLLQKPNGLYASMWARQVSAPPCLCASAFSLSFMQFLLYNCRFGQLGESTATCSFF